MRVLIADDSALMRRLVTDAVVSAGHEVVGEVEDGEAAIAAASLLQPDVVVMDWDMPGMDGVTATAAIRAEDPQIKVVAYSSAPDDRVKRQFLAAGAYAYVSKSDSIGLLEQLRRLGGDAP